MYAPSPISSAGLYTPSRDEAWNLFDDSFQKSMETIPLSPTMDTFDNGYLDYPQIIPQSIWNPDWSPGISPPAPASPFLPLSLIYDPSVACDDEAGDETGTGTSSYPSSEIYESPQSPRKAAWGFSTPKRRTSSNSKPERQSTCSKRRSSSIEGSAPRPHQLRSTKQGQKIVYAERNVKVNSLKGARTSHNLVEKVYPTHPSSLEHPCLLRT